MDLLFNILIIIYGISSFSVYGPAFIIFKIFIAILKECEGTSHCGFDLHLHLLVGHLCFFPSSEKFKSFNCFLICWCKYVLLNVCVRLHVVISEARSQCHMLFLRCLPPWVLRHGLSHWPRTCQLKKAGWMANKS